MKRKTGWLATSLLVGVAAIAPSLVAAPQNSPPAADNTKQNEANRGGEPTADKAKNNVSDRDLMQKIRKAIIDDKSLSTYGHNVKVIAQHGQVTLKGPVRSDEEKRTIEQKATEVAGSGNVTNQITIKPAK